MKLIILAAGEGTRLRPHTLDKPKCMVVYNGKPIIDYILDAASDTAIDDVVIVDGYKSEVLRQHLNGRQIRFCHNPLYASTNMVASFFCAAEELNDDIIISYADIIYNKGVLTQLLQSEAPFSVVVDKDWFKLWAMRMENPLDDAETLKLKPDGTILDLGKKTNSLADIQGQYIGLIKIKKEALQKVSTFYHQLDKEAVYDGKNYANMFMTSFIQLIIERLMPVKPVFINGGWFEIDSVGDLESYSQKNFSV